MNPGDGGHDRAHLRHGQLYGQREPDPHHCQHRTGPGTVRVHTEARHLPSFIAMNAIRYIYIICRVGLLSM